MMNQGMSREVGCLNLLLSHFFIEKMFYFQFKVNLKKIPKDDTCTLHRSFKQ